MELVRPIKKTVVSVTDDHMYPSWEANVRSRINQAVCFREQPRHIPQSKEVLEEKHDAPRYTTVRSSAL